MQVHIHRPPVGRFDEGPRPSVFPLDVGHWHLWQVLRHLFPPNAKAVQTDAGFIAISWSMEGDPHATQETAAPIVIKASGKIFDLLQEAPLEARTHLEEYCLDVVKKGLTGYDPYAVFPQLRVITVGDDLSTG